MKDSPLDTYKFTFEKEPLFKEKRFRGPLPPPPVTKAVENGLRWILKHPIYTASIFVFTLLAPLQHSYALKAVTAPPEALQTVLMVEALPESTLAPLPTLGLVDFPFSPMGTYPNSYPDSSQCTWGAASMKGNIPAWGDARYWPSQARASGITVSSVPIVGSVAISEAGYYGHAAVVIGIGNGAVTVEEKNFDWNGGVRIYTYPTNYFVYLYM